MSGGSYQRKGVRAIQGRCCTDGLLALSRYVWVGRGPAEPPAHKLGLHATSIATQDLHCKARNPPTPGEEKRGTELVQCQSNNFGKDALKPYQGAATEALCLRRSSGFHPHHSKGLGMKVKVQPQSLGGTKASFISYTMHDLLPLPQPQKG